MTESLRNLPMWCPQHKGQSRVSLVRYTQDLSYPPELVKGLLPLKFEPVPLAVEPVDEFWDEEGRLHCHYTYLCSKGHSFTLPCEADPACLWGRAVSPPPIVANGTSAAVPPPPPVAKPPPPPPPVIKLPL